MNVLLIDIAVVGHHPKYIEQVYKLNKEMKNNVTLLLPQEVCFDFVSSEDEVCVDQNITGMKKMGLYNKVIKNIKNICKKKSIDLLHFLSGDIFYKFFGYKLSSIKCKKIFTFHHYQSDFLHKLSMKRICKKINKGVVHTDSILNELTASKINNIEKIEYPYFDEIKSYDLALLKEKYEIDNRPIFLSLGETRFEKGIDILLKSLNNIVDINLIIAGREKDFTSIEIESMINENNIKCNIKKIMRFISDEELNELLFMCDYIVLPYRKSFDGASGPLVEGVMYGKPIIGPNHGSLNDLIVKYNLGYTFESENPQDLNIIISKCLNEKFIKNESYLNYQKGLSLENFIEKYTNIYKEIKK